MFRIHGKQYGIAQIGGFSFNNDPGTVRLNDFQVGINETFINTYDFVDERRHQLRVKAIDRRGLDYSVR